MDLPMGTLTVNATNQLAIAIGGTYTIPLPSGYDESSLSSQGAKISTRKGNLYSPSVSISSGGIVVTNPTGRVVESGDFDRLTLTNLRAGPEFMRTLTQASYDAIATKDDNTLYVIVG
jgi:hypothetical protein